MTRDLEKFFEHSLDLLCIADTNGFFKKVNPAFTRTLGWDSDTLTVRPFTELVHPEDLDKTLRELDKLRTGVPTISFENRFRCASGEYRYLMWTSFPDVHTQLLYAVARDITESKRTEQQVRNLAFSVKQRILQLNHFIDTGIDILRIDQNDSLIQLAVERATALTNASRGVVQITALDGTMEHVFFPGEFSLQELNGEDTIQARFRFLEDEYLLLVSGKESRTEPAKFETIDNMLLQFLGQQVKAALENRYYINEMIEKQRMNRELELAATIQKTILPESLPEIEGYVCTGLNIPSKEVGGDFYEIIPLPDGRMALVMADVAGKGVYSALLVNSLHAAVHAYLESNLPLPDIAEKLNRLVFDITTAVLFITCFIAILDPKSGKVDYLNAGHIPPFVMRKSGQMEVPRTGGPPLGCLRSGITFASDTFTLQDGDAILLYTDGVTEATNPEGEFYQKSGRFELILQEMSASDSKTVADKLVEDIRDFTQCRQFEDDITILYLRRQA